LGLQEDAIASGYCLNNRVEVDFEIDEFDSQTGLPINRNVLPESINFKLSRNKVISETAKLKKDVIDRLYYISWTLALIIAIGYIVLKVLGYEITTTDIAILGAIIL